MNVYVHTLLEKEEEASKQGQTIIKAKQRNTPKAHILYTFPKKNELPRSGGICIIVHVQTCTVYTACMYIQICRYYA